MCYCGNIYLSTNDGRLLLWLLYGIYNEVLDGSLMINYLLMDTGLMYWWILELVSLIIDICMLLKYKCECWWHGYTTSFDDIDLSDSVDDIDLDEYMTYITWRIHHYFVSLYLRLI